MGGHDRLHVRLARLLDHAGANGFNLHDLVRAAAQADVTSLTVVVDWLAQARAGGVVEDVGFDVLPDGSGPGPRRYRKTLTEQRLPGAPLGDLPRAV